MATTNQQEAVTAAVKNILNEFFSIRALSNTDALAARIAQAAVQAYELNIPETPVAH